MLSGPALGQPWQRSAHVELRMGAAHGSGTLVFLQRQLKAASSARARSAWARSVAV